MRTTNYTKNLGKLAGMKYHGGKTIQHWVNLVKIDPSNVEGIEVKDGKCYWTKEAENAYKNNLSMMKTSGAMLTDKTLV